MNRACFINRRIVDRAALVLGLVLLLTVAGTSSATTYVAIEDGHLLEQADVVVEVAIVRELPRIKGARPNTEFLASAGRVVKGTVSSSTLVVRVPGGLGENGATLFIPGAPRFDVGDQALLFLSRNSDESFSPLHMALGTFYKQGLEPYALAVRPLDEATLLDLELNPLTEVARDYNGFVRWLSARKRGLRLQQDYFIERTALAEVTLPYNLMEFDGKNVRWFEFDDGDTVDWRFHSEGGMNARDEFEAALGAWRRGPVELVLSGETGSTSGFARSDGLNSIIFGDPNDSVAGSHVCGEGGTLASGGWWTTGTGEFKGQTYARIVEAEIVVNDGVECLLEVNPTAAAELFTHELGHTLGIGHSCGDDRSGVCGLEEGKKEATMRATLHDDDRGASVRADDNAALAALYGAPTPTAARLEPSALTAEATTSIDGRLTWEDNTLSETQFEVWRAIGEKAFKRWRLEPADTVSLDFTNAKPRKTYRYRVRAVLGNAEDGNLTDFSNTASVTMPDGFKKPKKLRVASTGPTSARLTWKDKSNGEKKFAIERRTGAGEWKSWRSAPAEATSLDFDNGKPGKTYSFPGAGTRRCSPFTLLESRNGDPARMTEPARSHERLLVFLLRVGAVLTGSAFFAIFLPESTMASIHLDLGLGEFPATPLTNYLTRSLSAMYAFHGGLLFVLLTNVRRFRMVILFVGCATAGLGVALTAIDLQAPMPGWWTFAEGPWVVVIGIVLALLARKVRDVES